MMQPAEFDETLRQFRHREPFVPIEVELDDGRVITIPEAGFVYCDGAASYLTADYEMIAFGCEHVAAIRPARREAAHDR